MLTQKKRVYQLEQQLYTLSKENDGLKSKNKLLYDVVNNRSYHSSQKQSKTKAKAKTKASLWRRFLSLFRTKKRIEIRPARLSSASSAGTSGVTKESIQMMRRSSDGMKASSSSSNLVVLQNTSIINRVKKYFV